MIELAFITCLATTPSECETHRLLFVDLPVMACMLGAPAQLAAWSEDHPGWRIERWSCGVHDPSQVEA